MLKRIGYEALSYVCGVAAVLAVATVTFMTVPIRALAGTSTKDCHVNKKLTACIVDSCVAPLACTDVQDACDCK
ncbi:MAG: hypothetical protein P4L84_03310 [Isosphaeraceae bacterium]|nr:hypothetical protein [Isosphaeraceae bacterium]